MFKATQGEGLCIGLPVYFIRTYGCNMQPKCEWCDSKYSWQTGEDIKPLNLSVDKIINKVLDSGLEDVVITGGEPLLHINDIHDLITYLPKHTFHLETNGSLYNDKVSAFNFIACSPKKQMNDGRESYKQFASLPQTFFKFVYENKNDAWWVPFMEKNNIDKSRVWIMPEGSTREEQISKMPEVIEYCLENKFHFSPRLHILAYDTKRGV